METTSIFMQMHNGTRTGKGSFYQESLKQLFYDADHSNRVKLVRAFPDFFGDSVPEFRIPPENIYLIAHGYVISDDMDFNISGIVKVKANSPEEALQKVRDAFMKEELEENPEDFFPNGISEKDVFYDKNGEEGIVFSDPLLLTQIELYS